MKIMGNYNSAEFWDVYVGESPDVFMAFSKNTHDVTEAVDEYATNENFTEMFNNEEEMTEHEIDHIKNMLIEYIRENMKYNLECSNCGSQNIIINEGSGRCYMCGYSVPYPYQ